ncbi:protein-L-isoaspartate(D-aspartate) O-methyltransferase [Sulfurimonas sp. MAG313]|nr:protein-L-isoaspartate(D-aspartate) O-methyltransferase [Sulfurimonas sp. MAG313]
MNALKNAKLAEDINSKFALSEAVRKAIATSSREAFVPPGFTHNAYKLDALPIGANQWISSPLTVAKMSEYLFPQGADSVLEIGCGSGYQAAVLSKLFRRVFTIERIEPLMIEAKQRFRSLNISNIHTRTDDGQGGWIQYSPYDRILFSASATHIPQKIIDQLAPNGIIVAPIERNGKQFITRFTKNGNSLEAEELEECVFVPILNGVQK